MATEDTVISIARNELGIKEYPAGSNRQKYGLWYGVNGVPWCAQFISWVLARAHMNELRGVQNDKGSAYCPYIEDYYRQQGRWYGSANRGDIVLFDWGQDGVSDHIGFIERIDSHNTFTTIEGNTSASSNSNGGEVQRRTRYMSQIRGFGRPLYDATNSSIIINSSSWIDSGSPHLYLTSPLMSSSLVKKVQEALVAKGYSLPSGIDSKYGPETKAAVEKFQNNEHLEVDGEVGELTWTALIS